MHWRIEGIETVQEPAKAVPTAQKADAQEPAAHDRFDRSRVSTAPRGVNTHGAASVGPLPLTLAHVGRSQRVMLPRGQPLVIELQIDVTTGCEWSFKPPFDQPRQTVVDETFPPEGLSGGHIQTVHFEWEAKQLPNKTPFELTAQTWRSSTLVREVVFQLQEESNERSIKK